jgi:hypothetical protein
MDTKWWLSCGLNDFFGLRDEVYGRRWMTMDLRGEMKGGAEGE